MTRQSRSIVAVAFLATGLWFGGSPSAVAGDAAKVPAGFHELMQQSMQDKSGLTFFVKGQTIAGIVTAITDDGAVEVRNQLNDRISIRLDRVDALGR